MAVGGPGWFGKSCWFFLPAFQTRTIPMNNSALSEEPERWSEPVPPPSLPLTCDLTEKAITWSVCVCLDKGREKEREADRGREGANEK